jgi:hypothetical protein
MVSVSDPLPAELGQETFDYCKQDQSSNVESVLPRMGCRFDDLKGVLLFLVIIYLTNIDERSIILGR